jgi:hypothetical protein
MTRVTFHALEMTDGKHLIGEKNVHMRKTQSDIYISEGKMKGYLLGASECLRFTLVDV